MRLEDKNIEVVSGEVYPLDYLLEDAAEGDSFAQRELMKNGWCDYSEADAGEVMEPRDNQ